MRPANVDELALPSRLVDVSSLTQHPNNDMDNFEQEFKDLWENKDGGNVLIRSHGNLGYTLYNYKKGTRTIIEDASKAKKVIARMLECNIPVFDSINDLPSPTERVIPKKGDF